MSISSLHCLLAKLFVGLSNYRVFAIVKFSVLNLDILIFLQRQGYIGGFLVFANLKAIKVFLRYIGIAQVFRLKNQVSKQARRVFLSTKRLRFFLSNNRLSYNYLISTPFGFFFGDEVLEYAFGGEILFYFS